MVPIVDTYALDLAAESPRIVRLGDLYELVGPGWRGAASSRTRPRHRPTVRPRGSRVRAQRLASAGRSSSVMGMPARRCWQDTVQFASALLEDSGVRRQIESPSYLSFFINPIS